MTHRALVAVAVFAVAAAGCSSGSGSTASKPDTSSTTHRRRPQRSTTTSSRASTSTTTVSPSSTTPPATSSTTTPASPGTCGARSAAIYAAVQGGGLGPVPLGDYAITDCRIAASNQIWSAVTLKPLPGKTVIQLTVALLRLGSIWTVSGYGPDHVSCDAPPPVPTELHLGC